VFIYNSYILVSVTSSLLQIVKVSSSLSIKYLWI